MTEIKASAGKLYVSAIFDCYNLAVLGLAMDTNMKATLCEQTLDNAYTICKYDSTNEKSTNKVAEVETEEIIKMNQQAKIIKSDEITTENSESTENASNNNQSDSNNAGKENVASNNSNASSSNNNTQMHLHSNQHKERHHRIIIQLIMEVQHHQYQVMF